MGGRMSCAAVCAVGLITAGTRQANGQDAATASPGQSAAARGDSLMRAGRTAAAVEVWRAGLKRAPGDVTLLWKSSIGLSSLAEETPGHEGDEGAQRLWRAHPEWVNEVWFSELAPRDVDTESDIVELRPRQPGSG